MRPGRFLIGLSALATAGFIFAAAEACATMPVKDWEVGPINAPSSSGVGYCSVKNFYQQGQGLVVARDAEGSASLALSFQQKFMTSGGQYTIGLRAGSVARQMIALAATPRRRPLCAERGKPVALPDGTPRQDRPIAKTVYSRSVYAVYPALTSLSV